MKTHAATKAEGGVVDVSSKNGKQNNKYQPDTKPDTDPDAKKDPPEVVLFVSVNNTSHSETEVPEVLEGLQYIKEEYGIDRKMILITDHRADEYVEEDEPLPDYQNESGTSLGMQNQESFKTWQSPEMQEGDDPLLVGEYEINGKRFKLMTAHHAEGTFTDEWEYDELTEEWDEGADVPALTLANAWKDALIELGLDPTYAIAATRRIFLKNLWGDYEQTAGGTNELLEYIVAMYRAEMGEYLIKNIIISGHHVTGDGAKTVYGEGDDDSISLRMLDIFADLFPKAYAQVESLNFSACNTYDIDQNTSEGEDETAEGEEESKDISTGEHLQQIFPNIEVVSWWKGICPTAQNGAKAVRDNLIHSIYYSESEVEGKSDTGDVRNKSYGSGEYYWESDGRKNYSTDFKPLTGAKRDGTPYYSDDQYDDQIYRGLGAFQGKPLGELIMLYKEHKDSETTYSADKTRLKDEIKSRNLVFDISVVEEVGGNEFATDKIDVLVEGITETELVANVGSEYKVEMPFSLLFDKVISQDSPSLDISINGDGIVCNEGKWEIETRPGMRGMSVPSKDPTHYDVELTIE
jgi:hypothetical protein